MVLVYYSGRGFWVDVYDAKEREKPVDIDSAKCDGFGLRKLTEQIEFTGLFLLEEVDYFKLKHEGKVRVSQLRYSGRDIYC